MSRMGRTSGSINGALIGFVSGTVLGLLAVISEETADCELGGFFSWCLRL
jgi:hypothetical protein